MADYDEHQPERLPILIYHYIDMNFATRLADVFVKPIWIDT